MDTHELIITSSYEQQDTGGRRRTRIKKTATWRLNPRRPTAHLDASQAESLNKSSYTQFVFSYCVIDFTVSRSRHRPLQPTLTKHLTNHKTDHWAKTRFLSLLKVLLNDPIHLRAPTEHSTAVVGREFRGVRDPSPGHLDQQVDEGISQWQLGDIAMVRLQLPDLQQEDH